MSKSRSSTASSLGGEWRVRGVSRRTDPDGGRVPCANCGVDVDLGASHRQVEVDRRPTLGRRRRRSDRERHVLCGETCVDDWLPGGGA
jgi:hypothetical protein